MSQTVTSTNHRRHWQLSPAVDEAGLRLDQFLARHCTGMSRGQLRKLIDLGGVHIDGRRVRGCSREVGAGEAISVYYDGASLAPFILSDSDIIYRDRYLLALDKPAGIETQPTPARYQGTLYAALLRYLPSVHPSKGAPTLAMVQRLDRETSGTILFSIHPASHKRLTEIIASRQAQKTYLALISGHPPLGDHEIISQLARCRDNRVRSVERGGKEAVTRYRVRQHLSQSALVEVELLTGRMHQIRAHLAEAGYPLLGDCRYGGPEICDGQEIRRQMLHAASLILPHPVTGELLTLKAPLPPDMSLLLSSLGGQTTVSQEQLPC